METLRVSFGDVSVRWALKKKPSDRFRVNLSVIAFELKLLLADRCENPKVG
jgi:hypothetical protein